jgi:phenolphthiocerol/phthiocerol/phthiodiolone dimycocerosyl transferase
VCVSPADLRGRVRPPVGATETTYFDVRHRATVNVARGADPIVIGKRIKAQLEEALASGRLVLEPIQSPPPRVETAVEQRLATAMVSNSRRVRPFVTPQDVAITDFFVLRSGEAPLYPAYSVRTYGDRLNIRYDFPNELFTEAEVDALVAMTSDIIAPPRP